MKTRENRDFNAMVEKVKEEVKAGVSGKKLTITDISMKMTKAFDEIKTEYIRDMEEAIKESQNSEEKCHECGNPLKKTGK
jgi:hypothetical protein